MGTNRPAPPAPDTPNTGRIGKYRPVEAYKVVPKKDLERKRDLWFAVGAGVATFGLVAADIIVRVV